MKYPSVYTILPSTQFAPGIYSGNFDPTTQASMPMLTKVKQGSLFIQTGMIANCAETCVVKLWIKTCPMDCDTSTWLGYGADTDDQTASEVPITPAISGLTATNVAAALAELLTKFGVSAQAGNLLINGSDGKPYLDCEKVQDCIGQAIANGVGLTYDDAMDAIRGAFNISISSGAGAPPATPNAPTIYTNTSTGDKYYRDVTGATVQLTPQWTKQVVNSGATLPIASVANAGAQPLVTASGQFQVAETNDIVPAIGTDGVLRDSIRRIFLLAQDSGANQTIPPLAFTIKNFPTLVASNGIGYDGTATATIQVAGLYHIGACTIWQTSEDWSANAALPASTTNTLTNYVYVNGLLAGFAGRAEINKNSNTSAYYFATSGSLLKMMNAGDTVNIRLNHSSVGNKTTISAGNQTAFYIARVG